MGLKCYYILISGKVQKVSYRKYTSEALTKEGFRGYVKNLKDKRVEAVIETKEENKEKMISILKKGSPLSRVDNIELKLCTKDFKLKESGVEIRY